MLNRQFFWKIDLESCWIFSPLWPESHPLRLWDLRLVETLIVDQTMSSLALIEKGIFCCARQRPYWFDDFFDTLSSI